MKYEITKGSEKDFEGVPVNVLTLYRFAGHIDLHGSLLPSIYTHISGKTETIAERRPITEPVVDQQLTTGWDGEGLPPVGALCRYRAFSDTPWVECEVLGWNDDDVWLKRTNDGGTFVMGNPELFPTKTTEWNGEGLPPTGVECEYELYAGMWKKCRIEFVGKELMIVSTGGAEFSCNFYAKFRPIRSPEDVARDEAIASICFEIGVRPENIVVQQTYDAIAAGKIPGITLSGK